MLAYASMTVDPAVVLDPRAAEVIQNPFSTRLNV
jgi:hypothetical protein